MKNDAITQALLSEYSEMRSEIRAMLTTMNTNINLGVTLITGIVSVSVFMKDSRPLYLIPTLLFVWSMIMLANGASIAALGTYCQLLSKKIKDHLGANEVVFDWESGRIWQSSGHPLGLVVWGFYLAEIPPAVAFVGLSWAAFKYWPPSLMIHGIEGVIVLTYGVVMLRHNTLVVRKRMVAGIAAETAISGSSSRTDTDLGTPHE